ncbi:CBS domain-containing protein [Exilibacterium tricleocarpae]|uniref:CBS domain-containing protein n=1 Tax=Exilibacterium tricleocarpae TaxID=2591008 RepID=A0A545TVB4_9GAMM|nr:CBS domain-containing protein [Exilibacterium tricleocarpae]TQV81157.1 CBS domain-containing protein [Exilibacterium tricleocarpae]
MKIQETMVSNVSTCHADAPLDQVALMMWNHDCGCIPVVDDEHRPLGVVTDRDIAMGAALGHKPLWDMKAGDITAAKPVYTCRETDDLSTALELMQEYKVRRLPVTNGDGTITGIVSMGDIIACAKTGRNASLKYDATAGMLKAVSGHHRN